MDKIEIIAQCQGLKSLTIEGGWRLSFDLFESRIADVQGVMDLVNRRANVKIWIEEISD